MPKAKTQNYRALTHVSVRASVDKSSPEYNQFIEWGPGDVLESYPPYTAIEEWLEMGAIEPVPTDSRSVQGVKDGQD